MTNIDFSVGFLINRQNLDQYFNTLTDYHSLLETSFDNSNATVVDAAIDPANIPNDPIAIMPARAAPIKIVAPPPIPNRFGSPNGLRVES